MNERATTGTGTEGREEKRLSRSSARCSLLNESLPVPDESCQLLPQWLVGAQWMTTEYLNT